MFDNSQVVEINAIEVPSEYHIACVLLLDTSGSMAGDPIEKLNEGVRLFKKQIVEDKTFGSTTSKCIDVAIVTFGSPVQILQKFEPVTKMITTSFEANGSTPLGEALDIALSMIEWQKKRYNEAGVPYYRPWIFSITDGAPDKDNELYSATQKLKFMEANKKVLSYCVGVRGFDRETMKSIFSKVYELKDINFPKLFEFLANSLQVQQSKEGHEDTGFFIEQV